MRNVILFVASSLDGFIATEDGKIDWLVETTGEGDNGYNRMYEGIEALVMGRKTYDIICELTDQYPHFDRTNYIFSSSTSSNHDERLHFVRGNVKEWLLKVSEHDNRDIWLVGGGELLAQFLAEDLVSKIILTLAPITIGSGIPLWLPIADQRRWTLTEVQQLGQFAQMTYNRSKN